MTRPVLHPVRPPHRTAAILALAIAGTALFTACESPFANDADRQAYGLIDERQRQTLQTTSDVELQKQMIPVPVSPEVYNKVPPTDNQIPTPAQVGTPEVLATQPAGTQGSAGGAGEASQPDPLAALLARTPPLDLDHQPELPAFPRPTAPGKTRLVFSLDDTFDYALAHSREYQSQKEDLYVSALNVSLARHFFEPQFSANTGVDLVGKPNTFAQKQTSGNTTITVETNEVTTALKAMQSIGVKQNLPLGGSVTARAVVQKVNYIEGHVADGASIDLLLQATIPFLRGAGISAQEGLIQAERQLIYDVRGFERFRRGFLVTVAKSYFDLVNQRAQVMNRFRSVRSYIFITQRTAALFEAGVGRRRVTQLDLQRAQQSEFQARNDLINAIQQYELSVDTFKILLGMPAEQPLDVKTQYLDILPPDVTEAAAVDIAERLRLDIQTARDQVDDARRKSKVAANQLLPDLNLNASVDAPSNPSVQSWSPYGNGLNYDVGVSLDWPLDRVAERNAYRQSVIAVSQAKRDLERQEDQLAVDVRDALRRVRQQQYLVSLQRSNIDLAVKRKEFADIQFKNGEIDNRDYLDAETALLDAQNNFSQSISSLQNATLEYLRGTDQLRVDYRGKLLVPGQAAGVNPNQNVSETRPVKGSAIPEPVGKPLQSLEPTTMPAIPNPNPNSNAVPP